MARFSITTQFVMSLILTFVCLFATICSANSAMKRLYEDLLSDYNRLIRPVDNYNQTVLVHLSLKLTQLLDLNMKQQVMTTNVWLEQRWYDPNLKWDPKEYEGVDMIHVPAEQIWQPDIVLFNNADGTYEVTLMTKAVVHHTGQVTWRPPAMYKSTCEIDVKWFPFDVQECVMKFGSWTYDGHEVDLRQVRRNPSFCLSPAAIEANVSSTLLLNVCNSNIDSNKSMSGWGSSQSIDSMVELNALQSMVDSSNSEIEIIDVESNGLVEIGIDMSEFYPSVEWDILAVPSSYQAHRFSGLQAPYPDISFKVRMRRKTLFYTVNLIIPVVGNAFLTLLVFYLPSDSGEKVTLSISVLVSLTVFFLLLAEIIPPTSLAVPLLGKYLLFTMVLVSLSICVTVGVLNIHFRTPATHELKPWMRWLCIEILPKFLFIKRPEEKHLRKELQKLNQNEKRKKVNRSFANKSDIQANTSGFTSASAHASGLLDPLSMCNHYDTDLGMPSYLPNDEHDHECLEETGSAMNNATNENESDFEIINSPLFEDEANESQHLPTCKQATYDSMVNTSQLAEPRGSYSSSMDSDYPVFSYSQDIQNAIDGILYIAQRLKDQNSENRVIHDWQFIAMVLDRLFLWIFTFICIIGSASILLRAPSLYDQTLSIDTLLSSIGRG